MFNIDIVFLGASDLIKIIKLMILPIRYMFGIISLIYLLIVLSTFIIIRKKAKKEYIKHLVKLVTIGFLIVVMVIATYLFSITVGVPITEVLGFDPVGDIAAGVQSLNAVMSGTVGTNIILLIILNYIISDSKK